MITPTLTTERLTLRPARRTDAPPVAEYLSNFAVAGNLSDVPHPYSLADARDWLAGWHSAAVPAATRFIIDQGDGAIGMIGFSATPGGARIGYWLGEPFWGHGIMTEAATATLDWYFTVTPDESILSGVFHFNMASLAIQQKLGFVETGRSVLHCLARKQDVEHIDTELTRDAFEAFQNKNMWNARRKAAMGGR